MKKKSVRKVLKWLAITVLSPVVLFLVLAILIYIPPIQNFIVEKVTGRLAATTGMQVSVGHVRLAFPLDLAVHQVTVVEKGDTLAAVRSLRLDVRLLPLLKGRADVDGLSLYNVQLNTKGLIANTYVRGKIRELRAQSHGVEWQAGRLRLDEALLDGATLYVALSDTVTVPDTTASMPWDIRADRVLITNSQVSLSLPGDSMRVSLGMRRAELQAGHFDTGAPHYAMRRLTLNGGSLVYATRSGGTAAGRRIPNTAFDGSNRFLWKGMTAPAHLSPAYVGLNELRLQVDSLSYDAAGRLQVNVRKLAFKEHAGLDVKSLTARINMDTAAIMLPDFNLKTAHSRLQGNVALDFKALEAGRGGHLSARLDGEVGANDVRTLAAGYADRSLLRAWPDRPLRLNLAAHGNMDALVIDRLTASLPGVMNLSAKGHVCPARQQLEAAMGFDLKASDLTPVKAFLPADVRAGFNLPRRLSANGQVGVKGERYTADIRLTLPEGRLSARATLDTRLENYDIEAMARTFPLGQLLPGSGMGNFTGQLNARGKGFDVFKPSARLEAKATVDKFHYAGYDLSSLGLDADLRNGLFTADFTAANSLLEGNGRVETTFGKNIEGRFTADLPYINLQALAEMKDTLHLGTNIDIGFHADRDFTAYGAEGAINNIRFLMPTRSVQAKDLNFAFATSPDTTTALVSSGDLYLNLGAGGSTGILTSGLERLMAELDRQTKEKTINQVALRETFPVVGMRLDAGKDNPLSKILLMKGIKYEALHVRLDADPDRGLNGGLRLGSLRNGGLLLDTVDIDVFQDSAGLKMEGYAKNFTKKNPHKFEVRLASYLHATGAGTQIIFLDEKGKRGFDLGLKASLAEGGIELALYPEHPVIAYRNFTVNADNHVFLGRDKSVRADVRLLADDGTGLNIYSAPADSSNDITLSLANVNLGELSDVVPLLPQMRGLLSGDLHVVDDHRALSVSTLFTAENFELEGAKLGNIGLEALYLPKAGGEHFANAYISANDKEVMAFDATYVDSAGGQLDGTAHLYDFPLEMLGGFMAGTDFGVRGLAKGEVNIAGALTAPAINGSLDLDSAHLYSDVYGVDFLLDERPIILKDSRLQFNDYSLYSGKSTNPLVINGVVSLADFGMDLNMRARNYELVNAKRKTASMIFGKVYANYLGTLRGNLDNLFVRGQLEILERTDMTYILKDSPLTVDDRLSDLVKFVSFEDTTAVAEEQPAPSGSFDMTLGISVSDAARFRCNLSEDGENYVNLEGGGNLTLRLTQQGDMRLTGRFTANSGEMKYSLPVIPLKTFNIVQGSYVDFTGDVMNPTLNITAKERVKATVTENDVPRSVAFDVGVAITQPLETMGLEFIIEAPEDLSVQNQLAAMTRAERGKTAVAMLATGMFMTDDMLSSGGSGFKASNALNAFLQSEIQNIAGSALKTIDVSIGMESGTSSTGTETTDYSFQFAKRFWNNRVSVIIGGKVSTGEDAQNSAESFIDNIAVEYRLDKSSTRYVKVFYDRSTQDPLEGQLVKTGAGLVLRRKTDRLGELFIFRNRKDRKKQSDRMPQEHKREEMPAASGVERTSEDAVSKSK